MRHSGAKLHRWGSLVYLLDWSFVICLTAAVLLSTQACPADSAFLYSWLAPADMMVVLMNLFVSSDGAHPPIWCGPFHEARGAGGPVTQRLWGELLIPVLHDIVIRLSSTASILPHFPISHLILKKKYCCLLIQQIYKVWDYDFFLGYMFIFFFSIKNEVVQHYKHAE